MKPYAGELSQISASINGGGMAPREYGRGKASGPTQPAGPVETPAEVEAVRCGLGFTGPHKRNAPCRCGSGKKWKKCCRGRTRP